MKRLIITTIILLCCAFTSFAQEGNNAQSEPYWKVRYHGEFNAGFSIAGQKLHRPFLETVHGVNVSKHLYAGIGVGLNYFYEIESVTIPIYANVKGMLPIGNILTPYVNLSMGGSPVLKKHIGGGFFCDFGAGLFVKKFNIGIGLRAQTLGAYTSKAFYIKTGVRF